MNNTIYDFFKANYGTIDSVYQANGPFHKYTHLTIKQLKRELAQLKRQKTPLTEVRYVSRLPRAKLGNSPVMLNQMIVPETTIISYTKIVGDSSKIFSRGISLFCLRSHNTTVQNFSLTSSAENFQYFYHYLNAFSLISYITINHQATTEGDVFRSTKI